MKGKNLLILLVLVAVLGGAWYFLSERNSAAWSKSGGGGGKVVEFPLNDVAQVVIKSADGELHLVKKGEIWTVQERADYPASFEQVGGLLRKLWELKTVQDVKVGPSQLARLELAEPGPDGAGGTLVQLLGADGKPIQALLLGKKQMRKGEGGDDMGMGMGAPAGFATGRYVKAAASSKVSLVSETLDDADAKPARWLAKDFLKVESPKSIAVAGPTEAQRWTLSRDTAAAEWKLAGAKPDEKVDTGKVSALNSVFSSPSFTDVQAPEAKLEDPVTTATIDTVDGFQYELKIGKPTGENYPVLVKVSGNFPKERTAAADEKPEDKTRLDGEFATKQKQNAEKLEKEKKFEGRAYLVAKFTVEPLLKDRSALLAEKPTEPKTAEPAPTEAKPVTPAPEPPKPAEIKPAPPAPVTPPKPAEDKPAEAKPPEPPKPAEVKPAEPAPTEPKPEAPAKPVEPAPPAEAAKPTEAPKPAEPTAPDAPKP